MRTRTVLTGLVVLLAAVASAHPPAIEPPAGFASGLNGPEGLAFGQDGFLYVGENDGDLRRVALDGSHTLLAALGTPLAGITVLRDGRILACALGADRIWIVDPETGAASVYAEVDSPNFVVQTRRGQVIASSSFSNALVDVTGGRHVVLKTGFAFPNGLAIRGNHLYVANLGPGTVVRLRFGPNGTLADPEPYASGLNLVDGIAFDRPGNLFAVGADTLWVIDAKTRQVRTLSLDPLLNWPANIAFGRTAAFGSDVMYLANFGFPLGSGTTVIRIPTNHRRARLDR